jgi:membrane-associated phospholipid phosphatase
LIGLGLGTAAVLANTPLDQHFQNWYHDDVRTRDTDHFADLVREIGDGWYAIPVFAGAALLGPHCGCTTAGPVVGEWGDRCFRSVLVGGPPVVAFQSILGASRPYTSDSASHWKPFQDSHGVSGHAFIGAIPFLTAANMSDSIGFKLAMYGLSALPAWSRVNDDRHFLSQALLGWWFGYLATVAVDNSQRSKHAFAVVPLASDDGIGAGVTCQW